MRNYLTGYTSSVTSNEVLLETIANVEEYVKCLETYKFEDSGLAETVHAKSSKFQTEMKEIITEDWCLNLSANSRRSLTNCEVGSLIELKTI